MKIKNITALMLVLLMMFTLVACSSSPKFIGQWARVDEGGNEVIEIKKDGTTISDGYPGTWIEKDGVLIASFGGHSEEYYYEVSGNTFTLSPTKDPSYTLVFEKI